MQMVVYHTYSVVMVVVEVGLPLVVVHIVDDFASYVFGVLYHFSYIP
jgi:hypothetical protein